MTGELTSHCHGNDRVIESGNDVTLTDVTGSVGHSNAVSLSTSSPVTDWKGLLKGCNQYLGNTRRDGVGMYYSYIKSRYICNTILVISEPLVFSLVGFFCVHKYTFLHYQY